MGTQIHYLIGTCEQTAVLSEELQDVLIRMSKEGCNFSIENHDEVTLKGYPLFLSTYPFLDFFLVVAPDGAASITEKETGMALMKYDGEDAGILFNDDPQTLVKTILYALNGGDNDHRDFSEKAIMAIVEKNKKRIKKSIPKASLEEFF